MEHTKQMALAYEIADALDDRKSFELFLSFTNRYTESYLREKLQIVMSTPESKIKRSRGAYFTHLVMQHAKYSRN